MAKSFEKFYPALTAFDNLVAACRQAACGKRGQPQVAAFSRRLKYRRTEFWPTLTLAQPPKERD